MVADASSDNATLAFATSSRADRPKLMEGMRCASMVVVASTFVSAESVSAKCVRQDEYEEISREIVQDARVSPRETVPADWEPVGKLSLAPFT
jgi:hypothetical protein